MWGLRPDLLRPSPKRALATASAHGRGEGRVPRGGHLSPPRLALDKCHVGLKAGFTPAVSQAGPFQPPPRAGPRRGEGSAAGAHLPPRPRPLIKTMGGFRPELPRPPPHRAPSHLPPPRDSPEKASGGCDGPPLRGPPLVRPCSRPPRGRPGGRTGPPAGVSVPPATSPR